MLKSPKAEFKAIPVSNIADKITVRKNKVEYIYSNTGFTHVYICMANILFPMIDLYIHCMYSNFSDNYCYMNIRYYLTLKCHQHRYTPRSKCKVY